MGSSRSVRLGHVLAGNDQGGGLALAWEAGEEGAEGLKWRCRREASRGRCLPAAEKLWGGGEHRRGQAGRILKLPSPGGHQGLSFPWRASSGAFRRGQMGVSGQLLRVLPAAGWRTLEAWRTVCSACPEQVLSLGIKREDPYKGGKNKTRTLGLMSG